MSTTLPAKRGRPSEGRSPHTYRLREETSTAIGALAFVWGLDATAALERAVEMAARTIPDVSKTYDIAQRGPPYKAATGRGRSNK